MSFKIRILILGLAVTFIPVNTVFAEDSEDFVACQQMKWKAGKKAKKNCFRDLARQRESEYGSLAEDSEEFVACQQMKWKAGKKAKKNCFRDLVRQIESELIFAEDSEDFVACQQMKWKKGKKAKKNCFRDLARQRESELTSVPSEPQFLVDKNGKDTGFTSITDLCTGVLRMTNALKAMGGGDAKPLSYADCIVEAAECIESAAQLNPEHEDSSRDKISDESAFGMAMTVVSRIILEDSALCTR